MGRHDMLVDDAGRNCILPASSFVSFDEVW